MSGKTYYRNINIDIIYKSLQTTYLMIQPGPPLWYVTPIYKDFLYGQHGPMLVLLASKQIQIQSRKPTFILLISNFREIKE